MEIRGREGGMEGEGRTEQERREGGREQEGMVSI